MDQKSVTVDDPHNLPRDILINEYQSLCKHFNELKASDDLQRQEIHALRRELQTALNGRNFLSAELEAINSDHSNEINDIKNKHRNELDECKRQMSSHKELYESLEVDRDNLLSEIEYLKQQSLDQQNISVVPVDNNQSVYMEKIVQIEEQNDELAQVVKDLQGELTDALKKNLQFENHIEDLKDRLMCAEENLQAKRDELEEKNELYENTQERLTQLSGELNALRSKSDTANERGNSLFAEVDDQRQKMKVILEKQKIHYLTMKKEMEESRQEIRKLKRENAAMYKEIEVCTHLFMNAEQHHTEKLNERIAELLKANESMLQKLNFTEKCLSDLTKQRDVKWLDPMIEFCKTETNDLKDRLYRCSIQKVNIAGTLRKSQEETARWRFEALKSRCVIAERESLLEDNKIKFTAIENIDSKVRRIDNENVTPQLTVSETKPLLSYKRKSLTNSINSPVGKVVESIVSTIQIKEEPLTSESQNEVVHVEDKKEDQMEKFKTDSEKNNEIKPKSTPMKKLPVNTLKTEFKVPQTENTPINATKPSKSPLEGTCQSYGLTTKPTKIASLSGILRQNSTNLKRHDDKKVKFIDGSNDVEKISSVRKIEKRETAPKTAIKKRIFVTSKKPANISE